MGKAHRRRYGGHSATPFREPTPSQMRVSWHLCPFVNERKVHHHFIISPDEHCKAPSNHPGMGGGSLFPSQSQ